MDARRVSDRADHRILVDPITTTFGAVAYVQPAPCCVDR